MNNASIYCTTPIKGLLLKRLYMILLYLGSCFSMFQAQAQESTAKAEKYFNDFEYALALEEYEKLLSQTQPSLNITEHMAHCYRLMNLPAEAEFWYRQTLNFPTVAPLNLFYLANACRQNGKYAEAKHSYLLYAQRDPSQREQATKLAASCDWAMQTMARPEPVVILLDSALSSSNADFSPVFYQNGIVFSSDRVRAQSGTDQKVYGWTGTPYIQLYYAERKNSTWSKVKALEKTINTQYHNATATFSPDFKEIFFTRTAQVKNQPLSEEVTGAASWQRYSKNDKLINRLEIYSADFKNGKWQEAKPLAFNNAEKYSSGHPALAPNGKLLYFVSDMPGGYGQTDIYFCERLNDGSWSKPVNAGPTINTAGKEVFPVVGQNNKLYFSSDGHVGMGGLDLFSAEGSKNQWKKVQNLYYPFNSPRDDFGLIYEKDGKNGFFSSNRQSDWGSDNIYRFAPKYIPCQLAGIALVKAVSKGGVSQMPVEGISITVLTQGADSATSSFQVTSNSQGEFTFEVKANTTYTIKARKKGYLSQTIQVIPDCRNVTDTVALEMMLNRDTPNTPIRIDNIYYALDKYDLLPESLAELDKVVAMLQDNPTIRIELSSHTDSRQTPKYNQLLSQARAASAVKYILSQGISPKRVIAKGYGETKLLNDCKDGAVCSEEAHQVNRRTEFKILK